MSSSALVSSVMKRTTVSVVPSTTLREVAEILVREDIGAVVVKGESGPAGVVTERDLVRAVEEDLDLQADRASDSMAVDLEVVAPDDDLAAAARLMVDGGIRHLPVVDGDEVVGMISIRDVLAALVG